MEQAKTVALSLVDVLAVVAEKKLKAFAQISCLSDQALNVNCDFCVG